MRLFPFPVQASQDYYGPQALLRPHFLLWGLLGSSHCPAQPLGLGSSFIQLWLLLSRWSPALRRSKFDIIPDAQKCLQCELESLKSQLQAQTKALGFLKQSVTTLEKQMRLQQIKIQQLEEVLNATTTTQRRRDVRGMWSRDGRSSMGPWCKACRGCTRPCETGRRCSGPAPPAACSRSPRRSGTEAQEEEITENLVNIQKMKKTPVKCGKVLTRMKKQDSEASNWSDTEEMPQGDSGSWRDDLQKAISDIWSAVHMLQKSIDGLTMPSEGLPQGLEPQGPQGALMPEPSTLLMGLRLRMGPGPFPAIIQQEPLLPTWCGSSPAPPHPSSTGLPWNPIIWTLPAPAWAPAPSPPALWSLGPRLALTHPLSTA
ncbi:coiled-coil domain-containing protein 159 [Manis javanica]|uniref:coiled-coil domain-containing protein 159 n=1 Tax=Manis javanica TaxID=9974 RepID=UPI003C6D564F